MTKNKILFIFFVLVFGFCVSADTYNCGLTKNQITLLLNNVIDSYESIVIYTDSIIENSTDPTINYWADSIQLNALDGMQNSSRVQGLVDSIPCSSNDTCSVDLSPLVQICSNIYSVVNLEYQSLRIIESDTDLIAAYSAGLYSAVGSNAQSYINVLDSRSLAALSNFNDNVSFSLHSLSNCLFAFSSEFSRFHNDYLYNTSRILTSLNSLVGDVHNIYNSIVSISSYTHDILDYVTQYLPYLESINESLAYLATNNVVSLDPSVLSNFFSVAYWDQSNFSTIPNYYMKSTKGVVTSNVDSQFPYDNFHYVDYFNLGTLVAGGFGDLMRATHSLNNYWYWFFTKIKTNELNTAGISEGLLSLSNIASRVDSYVLGDFSNKFNEVVSLMNVIVTNQLEQLTNSNISALSALVETNNIYTVSNNLYLSSIDSKLDVLDYIKILSTTPLSDYSGDGDYFGYLTNLYLNGSSDSGIVSTNWFERIEILLASLVFGDSGSSSISNEVEFTNFSEDTIENAFNDYTFQNELTSGISLVEDTGENFLTILRGFHNSLSSISQPQSIAIGIGGLDGQDTLTYQDVMHHHFQVSFNSGASDNFTLIVRSMTTIIWILVTMMFVYFSARWLLSKVLFFYRLMRTLITSLFLK